jgi:hypothetical protein
VAALPQRSVCQESMRTSTSRAGRCWLTVRMFQLSSLSSSGFATPFCKRWAAAVVLVCAWAVAGAGCMHSCSARLSPASPRHSMVASFSVTAQPVHGRCSLRLHPRCSCHQLAAGVLAPQRALPCNGCGSFHGIMLGGVLCMQWHVLLSPAGPGTAA